VADWIVGQRVVLECEFRLKGVRTDPSIVTLTARSPSGVVTSENYPTNEIVKRGVGQYDGIMVLDEPGYWQFRMEGAGVVDAVQELTVFVQPSRVL
jgi:hypothetical protein